MKLAILGGGGVRMPAFVRAVLASRAGTFGEICLFEPDAGRRDTICRLAAEVAVAMGHPGVVTVTADAAEAFTAADYVFSAIRVGGDRGRVIDEEVALRRGIVGQETTGPGGCAMALRTIPVVLSYCDLLSRCSPGAALINFTNPAGLITQAISAQGKVRAVGVCDTPGGTVARLAAFLRAEDGSASASYGGLNHLGWVCSLRVDGQERMGELLSRFEELQGFDHRFAAFDPALVRRVGAIPTEYVYYFYDARRYLDGVARAGFRRRRRGCRVVGLRHAAWRAPRHVHADRHAGGERAGRGAGPASRAARVRPGRRAGGRLRGTGPPGHRRPVRTRPGGADRQHPQRCWPRGDDPPRPPRAPSARADLRPAGAGFATSRLPCGPWCRPTPNPPAQPGFPRAG
jgi:hypothetical protein